MQNIESAGTLLYSKGHIDKKDFLRQVSAEYGLSGFTIADVKHTHLRFIPTPHSNEYDMLLYYSTPSRGAFAATVIDTG